MPIGVICNVLAVALGGLLGARFGGGMSAEFKEKLNLVFGVCSMGILPHSPRRERRGHVLLRGPCGCSVHVVR